jgi:hypothetical protein
MNQTNNTIRTLSNNAVPKRQTKQHYTKTRKLHKDMKENSYEIPYLEKKKIKSDAYIGDSKTKECSKIIPTPMD